MGTITSEKLIEAIINAETMPQSQNEINTQKFIEQKEFKKTYHIQNEPASQIITVQHDIGECIIKYYHNEDVHKSTIAFTGLETNIRGMEFIIEYATVRTRLHLVNTGGAKPILASPDFYNTYGPLSKIAQERDIETFIPLFTTCANPLTILNGTAKSHGFMDIWSGIANITKRDNRYFGDLIIHLKKKIRKTDYKLPPEMHEKDEVFEKILLSNQKNVIHQIVHEEVKRMDKYTTQILLREKEFRTSKLYITPIRPALG